MELTTCCIRAIPSLFGNCTNCFSAGLLVRSKSSRSEAKRAHRGERSEKDQAPEMWLRSNSSTDLASRKMASPATWISLKLDEIHWNPLKFG